MTKGDLGGSQTSWPRKHVNNDYRRYLSFWGSDVEENTGGCCHLSKSDTPAWRRDFDLYECDGTPRPTDAPAPPEPVPSTPPTPGPGPIGSTTTTTKPPNRGCT